jgi:hypothetical protein
MVRTPRDPNKPSRNTKEAWEQRRESHKKKDEEEKVEKKKISLPRLKFMEKELKEEENLPKDKQKDKKDG